MFKASKYASLLMFGLVGVGIAAIPPFSDPGPPTTQRVVVVAGDFTYLPSEVRINPGDEVMLRLESQDVVHGLAIDGYDVNLTAEPGRPAEVTFTADKPGKFRFRCSVACGSLHPFMVGNLRVGPDRLLWKTAGLTILATLGGIWLWLKSIPWEAG